MGKIRFDQANSPTASTDMTIAKIFQEYFNMKKHKIFSDKEWSSQYAKLFTCGEAHGQFPSQDVLDGCLTPACKTLEGNRRLGDYGPQPGGLAGIRRLFIADTYWMYFMESMGINTMLKIILKDYEFEGFYPIPNNSLASVIMEVMTRETRKGVSSTLSDRYYNYYRIISNSPPMLIEPSIYWLPSQSKEEIIRLGVAGFNRLSPSYLDAPLGRFFNTVLSYYRDRKITKAIQSQVDRNTPVDLSSIVSIISIIDIMKTRFKTFDFGRAYYNTLNAIIWFMAGLSLIWELRKFLGISYEDFYQFLSASYDIVHRGEIAHTVTASNSTYFKLNHVCADSIRSILLDLEVLDLANTSEVETWLELVENKFESFRVAYLLLTGIDLAVQDELLMRIGSSDGIRWPGWHPATDPVSIANMAVTGRTDIAQQSSPYRIERPESFKTLGEFKESPSYKSPQEYRSVRLRSYED